MAIVMMIAIVAMMIVMIMMMVMEWRSSWRAGGESHDVTCHNNNECSIIV